MIGGKTDLDLEIDHKSKECIRQQVLKTNLHILWEMSTDFPKRCQFFNGDEIFRYMFP